MSKIIKKLTITLMAVLLCCSSINWRVFAENEDYSVWADNTEIHENYIMASEGIDLSVIVSDYSLSLEYKWYKLENDSWVLKKSANNADDGTEFCPKWSQGEPTTLKFKCAVSGYGQSTEVGYTVYIENIIEETDFFDPYVCIGEGETYELECPYHAEDESGITYEWYRRNENTDAYDLISGAESRYYTVSQPGTYKVVLTETKYANEPMEATFYVSVEEDDPGFESYTVTYHLYTDEETGEEVTEAFTYSEETTWPMSYNENNFEKYREFDHKEFRYWSLEPDGTEFDEMIQSNTDLYAVYSEAHIVTYKYDGKVVGQRKIGENHWWEAFSSPHDLSGFTMPEGKGFKWYSLSENGSEYYREFYEDITLYIVLGDLYTVTYHAYGEIVGVRKFTGYDYDYYYEEGSIFDKYIVHDGEQFLYWSESENGPRFNGELKKDTDLYAVFGQEYTVTYYANGKQIGTKTVAGNNWDVYLDKWEFPNYEPVEGQEFRYWSLSEGGEPFRGYLTGDITLYAVLGVRHTVTYWCNGKVIGTRTVYEDESGGWNYEIRDFDYDHPEGMAFVYWSASEDGPRFSGYVTEDMNLYAVFEEAFTVTYYYEGKEIGVRYVGKSNPYDFRADLEEFYVTAPEGWGFSYWSLSEGGSEFRGPVTKDIKLYAVIGKLCTVSFYVDDTFLYSVEIAEGDSYYWYDIEEYYVIPEGMMFSHWSRTPGGERFTGKVYEDMNLYAVIVKAIYITYVIGDYTYTKKSTGLNNSWDYYPNSNTFPGYVPDDSLSFKWWSLTPEGNAFHGDLKEDTTVYAVFSVAHTVTYWYNNEKLGQRSVSEDDWSWEVNPGYFGEIEYPEGQAFAYWADKDGNRFYGPVTTDMDLYLVTEEGYVVTYYYQGECIGTTTTTKSRPWDYGYSLEQFGITPPEGYGLAYWSDSPDGERFEERLTGDVTLYAVLGKLISVEYYVDGTLITTQEIPCGGSIYWVDIDYYYSIPEDKDFAYWSTEENGRYFDGPVTEETTKLYAVFYQKYTVQFYQGNVLLGEGKYSEQSAYDISNLIRPEDFDKYVPVEGYAFAYWIDENGVKFNEEMLTRDIKLYAYFDKCITVRYHMDGKVIKTRTDATANNYRIDDYLWNNYDWTDSSYYYSLSENGTPYYGDLSGEECDLYIIRYKTPITITFDTQGGVLDTQSIQYRYGPSFSDYYVRDYEPTKDGYYFGGWFYDPEGTRPIKDNDLALDDFTLYAYWIEETKSLVRLDIYDYSGTGDVAIEGKEGEYPVGSTVTFKITVKDDRNFIYASYVRRNPGNKVTDISISPSLTREVTFKTTAGLNEVHFECYQGNSKITFIADPADRSKDVIVYTDRFGHINQDEIPSPKKEGYFLLGWKYADLPYSSIVDLSSIIVSDEELIPVYEKANVEANVKVELYRIKYVEDPEWGRVEKEELVDPSGYTITGAGKHVSGTDCKITVKSAKAAYVSDVRIYDSNGNEAPFRYYIYKEGENVDHFITEEGYDLTVPVFSGDQTVKIYIEDEGSVKVDNRTPNILKVKNNAADGIATGQTVTIEFEIADGYALDKERPFVYDDVLMSSYSRYLSMDGDVINNYDSDYGNAEYDLNENAVKVTANSISWKMGYGNLEFRPNIVFVGYNTPEENNLSDVLDVKVNDDYNAPGIVFFNNFDEAKEYNVTFSKAEVQNTAVTASQAAARGMAFVNSSSVTPVEGNDGIGYVILYVTKGKAGEAVTKQDPVIVKNLKSLNVKVEAGEFVSYAIYPADTLTYIDVVRYEVKDNKGTKVDEGYVSANDDTKHLVYEGVVATIGAPTITSSSMNTDGVTIKCSKVKGADEYVLYRKEGSGEYVEVARSTTTTLLDKKPWAGTKFTYAVKAHSTSPLAYSDYSTAKTLTYNPFKDVKSGTAHYKNILWAFNVGMVNGTSKTTFSPEGTCMRKSFAIMLWKLLGKPASTGTNPFTDIAKCTKNEKAAIQWCYQNKIVSGMTKTTFAPEGDVTRKAVVIMLWKAAGRPEPTVTVAQSKFTDISKLSTNEKKAILWAFENSITKGTTKTTFGPEENCTREQLCTFLARYNNLLHFID